MTTETKVEAVALEYVPGRLDETAPARIWLQVDLMADNDDRGDEFPSPDHVTWQDESLGGLEVQYVRADLHQSAIAALEGEVERLRSVLVTATNPDGSPNINATQFGAAESYRLAAINANERAEAAERRVAELEAAMRSAIALTKESP